MARAVSTGFIEALQRWPAVPPPRSALVDRLLRDAEYHGLGGVFFDSLEQSGVRLDAAIAMRERARDIDHQAHLHTLQKVDLAFARAGITGVPLKGALLAERLYPRPAARVTGDTDLLIREADIDHVGQVLESVGYIAARGAEEDRYRREHFHLHFAHPRALPLELHFHAYRGFGRTLYSEPLIARSVPFRDFRALHVLAPDDEVVYLATHAAAHKFGRWSWLFDLRLLIETLDDATIAAAGDRAHELGFARPVALAARLLVSIMGMNPIRLEPLGSLGMVRGRLVEQLLHTPKNPITRSTSRLIYTTALCSDAITSARWVGRELLRQGRSIVARGS